MPAFVTRYASAFLDVVTAAKLDTRAIDQQFSDFLATWEGSRELRDFFTNPAIPAAQKRAILDKLNTRIGMMKELRNLMAVLIDHDRIGQVAEVATAYHSLMQEKMGIKPAEIVTARELSKEERDALVAEVAKVAGARIDASFRQDKSILGGAVVRIGSTVYDGSVRGRLERLREELVG